MNLDLADEAVELGRVVEAAIVAGGGDLIGPQIETDPETRHPRIDDLLAPLGVWELAPRADRVELEAAAEVCRVVGRYALPYPVAARLGRLDEFDAVFPIDHTRPRADAADLPLALAGITADGRLGPLRVRGARLGSELGYFVVDVELGDPASPATAAAGALPLVLASWTLLGMVERAIELTVVHTHEREQFGRRLADFQGLQFQLTDAAVAGRGLAEQARYSLWSFAVDPDGARTDALALRLAALDGAATVLRIAHQLHGATGFCAEHVLSRLSRHSQPLRRLPWSTSATESALLDAIERDGFDGLFTPGDAAYPTPSPR